MRLLPLVAAVAPVSQATGVAGFPFFQEPPPHEPALAKSYPSPKPRLLPGRRYCGYCARSEIARGRTPNAACVFKQGVFDADREITSTGQWECLWTLGQAQVQAVSTAGHCAAGIQLCRTETDAMLRARITAQDAPRHTAKPKLPCPRGHYMIPGVTCVRCPTALKPDPYEPKKDNQELDDQCRSIWDSKAGDDGAVHGNKPAAEFLTWKEKLKAHGRSRADAAQVHFAASMGMSVVAVAFLWRAAVFQKNGSEHSRLGQQRKYRSVNQQQDETAGNMVLPTKPVTPASPAAPIDQV